MNDQELENKKSETSDTKNAEQAGTEQVETGAAEEHSQVDEGKPEGETAEEVNPVEQLKEEIKDLKDQNLRLFAEFENFRKRSAKERLELMGTANKDTLTALLPVLDDFDRALKSTEVTEENKTVIDGIKLIQHKLLETLKSKGLVAMESSIGKPFDVETMEAITQIPAPSPELAGAVIDEVEKGYSIGDKVLRYAKVVVGKE